MNSFEDLTRKRFRFVNGGIRIPGFLRLHGLTMVILMVIAAGCGRRSPNILLVTLDTTRADRLGCYGYTAAYTPTLDSLASSGIRFEHAFSPIPLTLPAHATMLTGLQPWEHGVRDNGFYRLADSLRTVASVLKKHSYWSGAVIGAYPLIRQYGLSRGFDVYDDGVPISGQGAFYPERKASEVTDRARLLMENRPRHRPAFLWVHYFDPHHPYEDSVPGLTGYDAEVAFVDRELGRFFQHISRGSWYVIVAGDHGEGLWDHGEQTHGDKLYNSTLRVPLILSGPGWSAGDVRTDPVTLADIGPTILSIAGVRDGAISGFSLLSPVAGPRAIRAETVHPYLRYGWTPLRSVQLESLKIIVGDRTELYNVYTDPSETENLVLPRRGILDSLMGGLPPVYGGGDAGELSPDARRALQALGYLDENGADDVNESRILAWMDRGIEFFGRNRFSDADSVFGLVLDHDTGNKKAMVFVGLCAMRAGDYERADSVFTVLHTVFPMHLPGKEGLAEVAFRKKEYHRAEVLYESILDQFPDHRDGLLWLAVINRMQGEFETSLGYYERYIRLVPDHAAVLKDMAVLLAGELNDPEGAEEYMSRARALDTNY